MLNETVYSFENIDVHGWELEAMENGDWINDTIVHLAGRKLEILANEKFKNSGKKFMLIPPETLQFFRHFPIEITKTTIPYFDIFSSDIAFIPFVNSDTPTSTGTHWSLLVWHTQRSKEKHQIVEYLDSHNCFNEEHSRLVAETISKLYDAPDYEIVTCECPQQHNTSDCGVFVIAFMEHYAKHGSLQGIFETVSQEKVTKMRHTFAEDYMK